MTLKICSHKGSAVQSFLRFSLKKQTPFALLFLVATLLICPAMLLREIFNGFSSLGYIHRNDMDGYFAGYTTGIFLVSVLLLLVLLLVNFGFLFSKKAGDIYHALPLTRNQLVFTRGIAALAGALFNMTVGFLALCIVNFLPVMESVSLSLVLSTYFMSLLFIILLWAFSLVFVVCSGGYFDFIIALFAVNCGLPAIVAIFTNLFENSAEGLYSSYDSLIYTTPFAYTTYKLAAHADRYGEANVLNIDRFTVLSFILCVLFTALLIYIVSRLFKIRKSDTAGEAYSFKFMPHIIGFIISAVGGYIIGLVTTFNSFESLDFWLFFIVGALVCSVAFGAIATRGFKTVKPSFIRGSAAIAVMLAAAILVSHGAKASANYIPKEDDIARIELNDYEGIVFEDNFSVITEMHAQIAENINNDYHDNAQKEPEIIGNIDRFTLKYILKNGRAVERNYFYHHICRDNLYDDMLAIMQTEEFMSKYYNAAVSEKGYITLTSYEYKGNGVQSLAIINMAEAKEFVKIYQREMADADLGIFGEDCLCLYIDGDTHQALYIPTSFDETLAFLEGRLTPENEFYNK